MNIRYLILVIVCAITSKGMAQTIWPDQTMKNDFENYVKSVDEFMHRFNGEELHPNVKKTDVDYKKKNMMWLFNFDVDKESKTKLISKIESFIKVAIDSAARLTFNDSTWFAKASILTTYKDKEVELTMILRTNPTRKKHYCWKICGIQGMEKLGIYNPNDDYTISNIDHEISFRELNSIFSNNKEHLFGYISNRNHIDQLSVFFTLCRTGLLKFKYVNDLSFIFTSVPDYVFSIREYGRRGSNAGWLISSFEKCNDKSRYINNLINK